MVGSLIHIGHQVPEGAYTAPSGFQRRVITNLTDLQADLRGLMGIDFAIDLETSGLDYQTDRIIGIALSFRNNLSYYIVCEHTLPTVHPDDVDWGYASATFNEVQDALKAISPLLDQEHVTVLAHNAKFELHFIRRQGFDIRGELCDTMLAAQIVNENRAIGLKRLAPLVGMELDEYSSLEHYPGFKPHEILGVPLPLVADYAMGDTEATLLLWYENLYNELRKQGLTEPYSRVWMPLLPVLQEMEARGIAMDMARIDEVHAQYRKTADDAYWRIWSCGIDAVIAECEEKGFENVPDSKLRKVRDVLSEGELDGDVFRIHGKELPVYRKPDRKQYLPRIPWFNPGSGPQIKSLLFDYLGLPIPTCVSVQLNDNGEASVDKDTLRALRFELGENAHPVISDILAYRKASKMISTYLDVYRERCDPDDHYAIRTNFNQAVTDTGRLSSNSPNLQNQPSRGEEGKLIRDLFVARPGMKLIVADYSMMELRMAAHYSRDEAMMRAFAEGLDLHALTAAQQTNRTYEQFLAWLETGSTEAKLARTIGKTSNFGLTYGMGAVSFQAYLLVEAGVYVTVPQAQQLIDAYNTSYKGLTAWKQNTERWVLQNGYVETIAGRRRRFPNIRFMDETEQAKALRQAVNARIQGSCADVMCMVMPPIQRMFRDYGGSLLLQVHDELVGEAPEEVAEEVAAQMSCMMVEDINKHLRVPLVAEAGVGDTWGEAK